LQISVLLILSFFATASFAGMTNLEALDNKNLKPKYKIKLHLESKKHVVKMLHLADFVHDFYLQKGYSGYLEHQ